MTPNTFPISISSLLWGGGRETCVWCLFAQGKVARVLGDGRGWKALVARSYRDQKRMLAGVLPSLASSCQAVLTALFLLLPNLIS